MHGQLEAIWVKRAKRGPMDPASEGRLIEGQGPEIRGETRPCERMDEACPGLREALLPESRGGVFGIVLRGGEVETGDTVTLEPQTPQGIAVDGSVP